MEWGVGRPRSAPERDAAKSLRGEMAGSVVRMRVQIARPMPRFCGLLVWISRLDYEGSGNGRLTAPVTMITLGVAI